MGNAIWTEDEENGGTRRGVEAYVDQAIGRWLRGELGMRYVNETTSPASLDTAIPSGITPYQYTSARAKLTAALPWWPRLSVFGEYEQDVTDFDARVLAAGGELQVANRTRLYARHEFISSLDGRFTLNPEQDRNVTLFGIETDALRNTNAFTEYRVSDVIGGRDAEAAIGLRNRWAIAQGLTLNTAVERVQSVAGDAIQNDDATAASIGVAYTRNPLWKGTGRVEYRLGETQNSMLSTFGVAAKLNDNWSFLGRSLFYMNGIQAGALRRQRSGRALPGRRRLPPDRHQSLERARPLRVQVRGRLGRGLREQPLRPHRLDASRLPVLAAPARQRPLRGQVGAGASDGPHEDAFGQLLAARVTYDIAERWDVGVIGSAQTTGAFDAVNFGVGAEVGYLLTKNLWLAGGYNFFGFDDPDLADGDYSNPGAYMRLRVKFDEDLFQWLQP